MQHIAIVGASLAGLRAAETLRSEGFNGSITMVGAEAAKPYNRPPLSKQILTGKQVPMDLDFPGAADIDVDWRLGRTAIRLDLRASRIELDDGGAVNFDGLIIATGVAPRMPDIAGGTFRGVHVVRTVDDAVALKADLQPGRKLIVVGAGFIGCEVAASARQLGLDVMIVDPVPSPMARVLTAQLGSVFEQIHRERGVEFAFGRTVTSIEGDGSVRAVILDDGARLEADIVVFGIGSVPAIGWLKDSGLLLDNGVVCDEFCLALNGGGRIAAAGDVASWANVGYNGLMMRVEHWSNAVDQGIAAARSLLHGRVAPYAPVMSMWSDQYEFKLQVLGAPALGPTVKVAQGAIEQRKFIAECWAGDRLMGVVSVNMPARIAAYRQRLGSELQCLIEAHTLGRQFVSPSVVADTLPNAI